VVDISLQSVEVLHGHLPILGYIINKKVAYLTDVKILPQRTIDQVKGIDVLIISALRKEPHYTHLTLEESLQYIELLQPKKAYLTHISHAMGLFTDWTRALPAHVEAATDGLEFQI